MPGGPMKTLPLAQVKMNLSRLVDQVVKTDEEIMITRNGRPAAVLVSPDEYEGGKETQAIRSDPELMAEIRRGLRALKRGAKLYTLEELLPQDWWSTTASGCLDRSRRWSVAFIPSSRARCGPVSTSFARTHRSARSYAMSWRACGASG